VRALCSQQYAQESLRHACKYGSIVVVRRILEESRDLLNASLNFRSQTALTIAARYGSFFGAHIRALFIVCVCVVLC
jgi:ankyrin repeat protein